MEPGTKRLEFAWRRNHSEHPYQGLGTGREAQIGSKALQPLHGPWRQDCCWEERLCLRESTWLLRQGRTWKALLGSSATRFRTTSCRRKPKDSHWFTSACRSIQTWTVTCLHLKAAFSKKGEKFGFSAIARTSLFLTGFFINYLLTCSWKPLQFTKCLLSYTESRWQNFNKTHEVLKTWALADEYHL